MDFHALFPQMQDSVASLPNVFPASLLKNTQWGFAAVEAVHLLALGLLGGCVLFLNLRLLGVGVTSETPAGVERQLRPWLYLGVAGVLLSGVLIGMLNPEKLFTSPAFFAKMIAMVAALIFSFGVTNAVASSQGRVSPGVMAAAIAAFALWLWSMGVFSLSSGTNPGTFHLVVAGYVILFAFGQRTRILALIASLGLMLADLVITYGVIGLDRDYDGFMSTTKLFVEIAALVLVALLGFEIATGKQADTGKPAKLIAVFSILSWVTVAAAGRWIGLS
ncbi:MAG: hypothetical protein GC155_03920 [Alphaproteobacteria bacterium]|nr:hypothetical protein [Alphaproteobacteria bacterium]